MIVGFTGTQRGMTDAQKVHLAILLTGFGRGGEFHHGDCIGADAEAHDIADQCGYSVILHPPSNPSKRAWREVPQHMMRREFPYLTRNHNIVNAVEWLIATPCEFEEQLRSGTWSTVRFAKRAKRKVCLILPDGRVR
jgi:hypothetical protein